MEVQGSHLINNCSSSPLNFLPFTIHPVFIKLHAVVIFMLPFIISMDYHQSFIVCCSLPCFLYLKPCSISLTSLTQTSHTSCHCDIVETYRSFISLGAGQALTFVHPLSALHVSKLPVKDQIHGRN